MAISAGPGLCALTSSSQVEPTQQSLVFGRNPLGAQPLPFGHAYLWSS